MGRHERRAAAVLNTGVIDAAMDRAAAAMVDGMATELVARARELAALNGLTVENSGRALAAALGYWVAESSANPAHLASLIGVASATVDACARGRYNDRLDEQKLIRGIPGAAMRRV